MQRWRSSSMKRKRLFYDEWTCILDKEQYIKYIDNDVFHGYISEIKILDVSSPQVWKFNGKEIVMCKSGYKWLSILPSNEYYCMTAMIDEQDQILLWYIDMIAGQGIDQDSMPYFYDLYLDLVVYPDGCVVEDDRDELEEALSKKDITFEQFELADRTCNHLKKEVLSDCKSLLDFTNECLSYFN